MTPEEMDWAPGPEMKSCRALLQEMGTMERVCIRWLTEQKSLSWPETWESVAWPGSDPEAALASLDRVREETLGYLERTSEEQLQTPIPLPEGWEGYFGGPTVEPEEMVRWIGRHEYYHLGQLITYRWIRGDNPYKREGS